MICPIRRSKLHCLRQYFSVNNKIIHSKIFLRDFCFVILCTAMIFVCTAKGPWPLQFKLKFCSMSIYPRADLFFKSVLSRKNWLTGGGLLLKNGTIDVYAYLPYLHWRFSRNLLAKYRRRSKKSFSF